MIAVRDAGGMGGEVGWVGFDLGKMGKWGVVTLNGLCYVFFWEGGVDFCI